MNRRTFLIAVVNAEVRAKIALMKFDQEFNNASQNTAKIGQNNQSAGNVPQQPAAVQQPVSSSGGSY
jgi:hypothetical protein